MNPLTHDTLYGSWATLILTTVSGGHIDFPRLEKEIDILISSSPEGIYSNGTAGEFYAQTEDEFLQISECLAAKCEQAGIPFQIGVSHMSAQISLERLIRIRHLRPGAIQVILPDWFPVSMEEAVLFMKQMEEAAEGIPLVLYNPPHAKRILSPCQWKEIKRKVPSLIGVKVSDQNRDPDWYKEVKEHTAGISVFIPGHHLATGIAYGTHGTYSNMVCLNPFAAHKWYELIRCDPEKGLELEQRIQTFMQTQITPFITEMNYPNHACDRFMVQVGGWMDIGEGQLRWPYRSIPQKYIEKVREEGKRLIPEFFY